ncbi:hypothetical protein CHLNCDRAFT_140567 [Chlorella variabilis]|uniref:Biotin carboxylase n=1 Tax=Chlorella variabilis TaxID=554065 RepID=E1Z5P4_CHLVA|nr:hypothetical protein CHLNCDRAFT_140567 [Chlorella variabilis]EFN58509.1 hypothetical protein CHLNCDRAFT_140567 [Chlorella variabilis]|eukprot:XP_005850611.1 hypothetical protein CHLNCDRAFT_140567 [Chlorella variabilis]
MQATLAQSQLHGQAVARAVVGSRAQQRAAAPRAAAAAASLRSEFVAAEGGDFVCRAPLRQQASAAAARHAGRRTAAPSVATVAEQKEIKKVLIANRGEIAVRVIRACRELGLQTVAVYSTADKDCLHVQLADEAVCIGEAPSSESYLSIPSIISAAVSRGADAIHPGYGFLSENATFVDICADHGLEFIGPKSDSIRIMGDKSTARDTMKNAGVPTVPGSDGLIKDAEDAVVVAAQVGFPIMIKATAGGGGRGMRLAMTEDEFLPLLGQAQQEAEAAFGNGAVYLERYVNNPRHIEFQVLADKFGNVVHLGERDCSIQRRNQKLLEEAPSPALTPEARGAGPPGGGAAAAAAACAGVHLIVWGADRDAAINRMKRALNEMVVSGVPTTAPFHILILENEAFKAGDVDTGFIVKHADSLKEPPKMKNMSLVADAAKRGAARRKSHAK